jgi:hypothetical protein
VQQVLGYDKAQQFGIIELDLPAWAAVPVMPQVGRTRSVRKT